VKNTTILALAVLSGVLYFTGFIGFDQWYLEWIAFVPLLIALSEIKTARRAFFVSWLMGWVTHMGGYYWIVHLLMVFAYLPLPLAMGGYMLLCLVQSGVFAIFGWSTWRLHQRTGIGIGWIAPVTLMASELVYPQIFQSFTANSQVLVPVVIQIADLGGVLLIGGLIALVSGAVAEVVLAHRAGRPVPRAICATAVLAVASTIAYGLVRMPQVDARDAAAPQLKVAMVQGNVGGAAKHDEVAAGTARYRQMTDAAMQLPGVGLVVWPESALNNLVMHGANLTGVVATEVRVPMLVGALRAEPSEGERKYKVWNSILAVAPGGQVVTSYDKIKLLVFGEYLPGYESYPGFWLWLRDNGFLPYIGGFERGTTLASLSVGPHRISADVCYEDILPRHINRLMAAEDTPPQAMLNGTNDSWYGPVEPFIHLALAQFRAVEHRRWLIRSTSTGISAFIDANGRIVEQSEFEKAQTLVHDVPMITAGPTVYARIGDLFGWLALVAVIAGLFWRRRSVGNANVVR
jgi:apolipoprotein N-acyltransferase